MKTAAKLIRMHLAEEDRFEGRPLCEAVVEKCREWGIAGATVFRGLEGFGERAEIHRAHLLAMDRPMVITIVDAAENIERVLPALEAMLDTGLIAISDVEMTRVQKSKP
jgi:PII-like signaling protein